MSLSLSISSLCLCGFYFPDILKGELLECENIIKVSLPTMCKYSFFNLLSCYNLLL